MTKEELIAALEKAEGPSRELDAAIFSHLYGWSYPLVGAAVHDFRENGAAYTASIDAALTLVPEGHCWEIRKGYACEATVWQIDNEYDEGSGRTLPHAVHRYPAIALCIAALKART